MQITVTSKIIISNPTNEVKDYCKRNLELPNPAYQKAINAGRSVWKIPRDIILYERMGNKLLLPFGCLRDIFAICKDSNFGNRTKSPTKASERLSYNSQYSLYPYQGKAVQEALKARGGIVVAPCGAGKTQMGLAIAERIGGRTLWLTHTQDLLNQSRERAKQLFNLAPEDYGTITAGKVDIGNVITFATVQTASKVSLAMYDNYFDCIIVDECHHCIGTPTQITMFSSVLGSLNARYRYGLTATPERSDGLSKAMHALLGEICAEVPKTAVKGKTVPFEVIWRDTGYAGRDEDNLMPDGTINFTGCINAVCMDTARNVLIANDIYKMEGATLVLTSRVEHCRILSALLDGRGKKVMHLSASAKAADKAARREALRKLDNGELDIVIATYPLAREGLDCPNLRNLVMACPIKERNTVIQSVGRVQRSAEGKTHGTVYDYYDNFTYFKACAAARKRIYKALMKDMQ